MSFLSKILGVDTSKTLDSVFNGIDNISTTKEEKAELRLKAIEFSIKDKNSARDMYSKDSTLQKIFAIVFLTAYVIVTIVVLYGSYIIAFKSIELNNVSVSITTMIFTAMSNKINTIVDFLFGGSSSSNKNDILKK